MTNTDMDRPPLGVGALMSSSLGLVFGNLGTLLPIAMIPAIVGVALNYLIMGPTSLNSLLAFFDPQAAIAAQANVTWVSQGIIMVVSIVLWGFIMTSMTKAAYDIKVRGSTSFGDVISTGLRYMLPILPLIIVTGIGIYIGLALLVLPGLYLMAMWFVIVPVFIVEQSGMGGAISRSAQLSEGYRWPLVGLVLLYVILYVVIGAVSGGLQFVFAGMGGVGLILAAISTTVIAAFLYCIGSCLAALVYARLREIKEGTDVSEIADIFA